jgi:ATP-dependent DNA helicase RecG
VSVGDDTGRIFAVWFNQPYLKNYFKAGSRVLLHGKVECYKDRIQLSNPEFEVFEEGVEVADADKIVPTYSLPEKFSPRVYRKLVKSVLDKYIPHVEEVLPFDVRSRHNLLNIAKSLRQIHFPENEEARFKAYERLSFEEFFIYQIPLILRKLKRRQKQGIAFRIDEPILDGFCKGLPFELTLSQKLVLEEIKKDMASSRPMQRLLQGDVGSGKTVVATLAALIAASNGTQTAFMVPTEILAAQHFEKLSEFFKELGPKPQAPSPKVKIGLLTSSMDEKKKQKVRQQVKKGEIDIIIGTHALIQEGVNFKNLGFIIIDEQHKFGVSQRALLSQKAVSPDILIMTATPIPRTLCMTLYGDLDISIIRELPKGRKKIVTSLYGLAQRKQAYDFVRGKVKERQQAYIVYPLIEESPSLMLACAKKMHKEFQQKIFKDFKVGLIHGHVTRPEQEVVMRDFRDGKIDILVATTVLEVGIDVPNATVMVIEHADRFGLSQLHQMRGRVGRGEHESFCLPICDPETEDAKARLKALLEHADGFKIAEEDLKIRGPGEFFGERQSGLVELKIANPLTQMHLLKSSREEVVRLIQADPKLEARQNQELRRQLYQRFPEFEKFMMVG